MTKAAPFYCLFLTAALVAAEPAAPIAVDAADKAALAANDSKLVIVSGTIKKAEWSKSGKVMNIEFENSVLIAAAFEKDKEALNKAFDGDAARKWTGAKVKLTGTLGKYGGRAKEMEGRPQIIINKPDQLAIQPK